MAAGSEQHHQRIHTTAIWGLAKVKGTFTAVGGTATVADHGSISGDLIVDAGSIDTRNKRRDKHLRSAEFFDVSTHPTLTFTACNVAAWDSFGRKRRRGLPSRPFATVPAGLALPFRLNA